MNTFAGHRNGLFPSTAFLGAVVVTGALSGLGPRGASAQTCMVWTQTDLRPSGRETPAMAYDSRRGVTVLFGGIKNYQTNGETWEWDGVAHWTHRSSSGPSARYNAAMAYDRRRGVVVLFGGNANVSAGGSLGDTWEWDGDTWTLRASDGPSPRRGAGMAFDEARGVTVLFGGVMGLQPNETVYGDTWEWDGSTWTQRIATGPLPLMQHAMVYDRQRGVTVLFGGSRSYQSTNLQAETWEWDGTSWVHPTFGTAPSARRLHAMAYDAVRGVTVLFGGYPGSNRTQETWLYDGQAWTKIIAPQRPPWTIGHVMVFDEARGVTTMFGGVTDDDSVPYSNKTWTWDGTTWKIASAAPYSSGGHRIAYDSVRHVTVLHGGTDVAPPTWTWDGRLWTPQATTIMPPFNAWHAMAFDSGRGVAVVFGGYLAGPGRTWEWDGVDWTERFPTVSPPAQQKHAMAYDSARGVTVLFGAGADLNYGETWLWDGQEWALAATDGPSRRYGHAMAFDSRRGVTVLFGGLTSGWPNAETWEWDGQSWTQRFVNGPSGREQHAMTYDSTRGVTVLFGGQDSLARSDIWEWDGSEWTQGPAQLVWCANGALTFDTVRHVSVCFGWAGWVHGVPVETWEYSPDNDCDGTRDLSDNCPETANADQADADRDGVGDVCDACPDTAPGAAVDADGCPLPPIPGDFDSDRDVDGDDLLIFTDCATGPAVPHTGDCWQIDLDGDGDIDQTDFAAFQRCYSGEGNPADPDCAGLVAGMVLIPAGEFLMGDAFDEGDLDGKELPRHAVYVDAFYMDRYEVTNQQYADALNWALSQDNLITVTSGVVYKYDDGTSYPYCDTTTSSSYSGITWDGSTFGVVAGKGKHPVVMVSWTGSAAYANWRSAMRGRTPCFDLSTWNCSFNANGYRLPTEAEWEKAARGGAVGRRFPWSDSDYIQHARANYHSVGSQFYDDSPTRGCHPTFCAGTPPFTSPVGFFAPNGYSLYDMAGNAWEWCNDWYSPTYYTSSPCDNPRGPETAQTDRVLRGGSWTSNAYFCRVPIRLHGHPGTRLNSCGFRLALDPD